MGFLIFFPAFSNQCHFKGGFYSNYVIKIKIKNKKTNINVEEISQ